MSSYCRKRTGHGGSCLYVKDGTKAVECTDFVKLSKERVCEVSAIELLNYDLIVLCIYRTNKVSASSFLQHFEPLLERASGSKKDVLMIGDTNIDWMKKCFHQNHLRDMLAAHNFVNIVDFPTRVCNTTATCLDHAYSNRALGADVASSVNTSQHTPDDPISDHLAVRIELTCQPRTPPPRTQIVRNFTEASRTNFEQAVASVDWTDTLTKYQGDPESLATAVVNILRYQFHTCFPLKKKPIKKKSWVSDEVLQLKSLLFETAQVVDKFADNEHLQSLFEDLSTLYDRKIAEHKANYYSELIASNGNKSRAIWRVVNTERGTDKSCPVSFCDVARDMSGKKFITRKAAADAMNSTFVSAAATCGAPRAYVPLVCAALVAARPPADCCFRITKFTADEVYKIITTRIPKKPTKDIYDTSMEIIDLAKNTLAPCLAALYNSCIDSGIFPGAMKLSKVSPLFKGKGKREDLDAYRPVSIIPAVAKIFENGLSSRLAAFLNSTGALSERQYAYRAGRSTTDLTREVLRCVLEACDNNQRVAVLCCDLSKAFDVADHSVLAAKLYHYGIGGPAHALLTDMLRGRAQVVIGDGGETRSNPLTPVMGVAQGSSVSNILFSLLLNDLPEFVASGKIFMYADDVAAVAVGKTQVELEKRLNDTASELAHWFRRNGLALNLKKTHFVQFSISGRATSRLRVTIEGEPIQQVETTTFLGFEIDRGLTWSSHIDKQCAKLGSACFALGRLSRVVSADVVRTCYFATVHSVLQYGAELWGHAADRLRAFRMQKRAVRAIAKVSRRTSARPFFKSLGIPTLPAIVIIQLAMYVRKNIETLDRREDTNNLDMALRSDGKLASVWMRLEKSRRLTHVMGPEVYNCLPEDIRNAVSDNVFKLKLKNWLIQRTFYSISDFFVSQKKNFLNNFGHHVMSC